MLLDDLSKPSLRLGPYGLHARNLSLEFLGPPPIIVKEHLGDAGERYCII